VSGEAADHPAAAAGAASGAVFLSYASEDADAAARLCAALRAAGIEVWFDRSELRGGDAWDQKIRRQIRDCDLFVPLISAHTQARLEGYFRREWKLAVDRTHDMAEEKAFLVPVVVDATDERVASVPERFRAVQWTRLPDGVPSPAFLALLAQLLAAPSAVRPAAAPAAAAPPAATPGKPGRLRRRALAIGLSAFASLLISAAVLYLQRSPPPPAPAATAPAATVAASAPPHSVAVLPFVNLSGDPAQEYFSEGLTEELLNTLARVEGLHVAARTSSFAFSGQHLDAATVARRLNVGALLEGSVRRSGRRVRVTADLVNAATGFHLWSHAYDEDLTDVIDVQTRIAAAVARELDVTLSGNQLAHLGQGGTRIPEAFDAYLRGAHRMASADSIPEWQQAVADFDTAIARDPAFAAAYMLRAIELTDICAYTDELKALPALRARAIASADKAVALAPNFGEAYATRGFVRSVALLDFSDSADFERALALAPGSALVLSRYASYQSFIGQADASLATNQRAIELDPENVAARSNQLGSLAAARRWPELASALDDLARRSPRSVRPGLRAWFALEQGHAAEAVALCEPTRATTDPGFSCLAIGYHLLGRQADAEAALRSAQSRQGDRGAFDYATVYAEWGDVEHAIEWLRVAARLRLSDMQSLRRSPMLDAVRHDPRYLAIEQEFGFPPR